MTAAKPPARQRVAGALASGFATAELHHQAGHDPRFDHVNIIGRYTFILPHGIARGELRPLRDPRHTADEG